MQESDQSLDYAIVGAGVAGTYAAWRLINVFPKSSIRLYEATYRIGGRLLSVQLSNLPVAELGGMRFTPQQILVANLVKKLPPLVDDRFEFEVCAMHLRGRHSAPGDAPPYTLEVGEWGKSPSELLEQAIRCVLLDVQVTGETNGNTVKAIRQKLERLRAGAFQLSRLEPKEWRVLKTQGFHRGSQLHRQLPLYDRGFWNLLSYYLSPEAFLYVRNALGYESIVANWNAAEAIPWFLRDFSVKEYRTLRQGMDALPVRLAAQIEQSCPVHRGHVLTKIARQRETEQLKLSFEVYDINGKLIGRDEVLARHVILALPRKPLREILDPEKLESGSLAGPEEIDRVARALNSVTPHALFKLLLGYEYAWWNDPRAIGRTAGRIVTDMPIRQVYYFGKADVPFSAPAMLMASYSDAHFVDFWMAFHRERSKTEYFHADGKLPVEHPDHKTLDRFGAAEDMVREAHQQVRQLHPKLSATDAIPFPFVGLVMEWSAEEPVLGRFFGGGWHTWNTHTKPWEAMQILKRPFSNVHICGEAYSCEQGWVEGALRSSELVLQDLGVPPPDFVADSEYTRYGFDGYSDYIEP